MKYSIFMVVACLPNLIIAMSDEAALPLSLQEALVGANKSYKEKILAEGLVSLALKKRFEEDAAQIDLMTFLSAATLVAHACSKESGRQLYSVQLYMHDQKNPREMPVCTVPTIMRDKRPMATTCIESIINKMIDLKLQLADHEKMSPSGTHWRALSKVSSYLSKITFDNEGNPSYLNKIIKVQSGFTFRTSKIVQLIDINEGNLVLKNEDIEDSVQALEKNTLKLNPFFILRERLDHYEAIPESISAAIILHSGQSSASSCSLL